MWIEQRVRNCSSTGWAGRHWWQRCCVGIWNPVELRVPKAHDFLIVPRNKPSFPWGALTLTSTFTVTEDLKQGIWCHNNESAALPLKWNSSEGNAGNGTSDVALWEGSQKVEAKKSAGFCHSLLRCRNGKGRKNSKKKKEKNWRRKGNWRHFNNLCKIYWDEKWWTSVPPTRSSPQPPPSLQLRHTWAHCKSLLLCTLVWGCENCGNSRVRDWESGSWVKLRWSPSALC